MSDGNDWVVHTVASEGVGASPVDVTVLWGDDEPLVGPAREEFARQLASDAINRYALAPGESIGILEMRDRT